MKAVRVTRFGGPEVLEPAELPDPEPGEGQLLVEVTRAGVNFADVMARENRYLSPQQLPLVPGIEVAGRAVAGTGFDPGRRVIALLGGGGYAEYAVAVPFLTFPIPDGIEDGVALSLLVQGVTAWHLCRTSARLEDGETVVVVAGAGGVGSLAIQLARRCGAGRVIATASTPEKRRVCEELGADATVDPSAEDLEAALREANDGRPVDAVFEMGGGRTFDACLAALAPFGRLVTFGSASGKEGSVSSGTLMRGSRAVIGFWLADAVLRGDAGAIVEELFGLVERRELRVLPPSTYALSQARRAHEDVEARRTAGKVVLDPAA